MQKTDWLSKWKPTAIETKVDVRLTRKQEMDVVKKIARLCPELLQVLLENPKWKCPFPFQCNIFPCGEDGCHADVCDNGHAYRLS